MNNWPDIIKLALPLLCIFGIVWLFLHHSKNFKAEKPRASVLYICGYAILLIIEFIVYICLNNFQSSDIINTISFGATLSSLILSVVAIIFTIVSGKHGEEQLGKITQATTELQHTARSLTEFHTVADAIIDALSAKFEDVDQKLRENLEQAKATHSETKAIHTDLLNAKNSETAQDSKKETTEDTEESDAEEFAQSGSYMGAVGLLACCYSKEKDMAWKVNEMGAAFKASNHSYLQGYIVASSAADYLSFVGQFPDITISACREGLKKGAETRIYNFISTAQGETFKQELIKEVHSLQSYFSVPLTKF